MNAGTEAQVATLKFGPLTFDAGRRQLMAGSDVVHLTPKSFDLLSILIEAAPRVVRRCE